MAQQQFLRIGFRRAFSRLTRIGLEREKFQILQRIYLPILHHATQTTNFSTNKTALFYDSIEKEMGESITDAKSELLPNEVLKQNIVKPFEIFESNPERYYFVRIYQQLNEKTTQDNNVESEVQDNFKILSSIKKPVSKVFKRDLIENIRSSKDLDAKLDALFDGLQKFLTITQIEDMKSKNYLKSIQRLLVDLSCYIFDQIRDKPNLDEEDQKKLFFNLVYLWLRVESHIKEITYSGKFVALQWNENSNFFLKFLSHYLLNNKNGMVKRLDSQELLFCLTLVGLHRRLPGVSQHTTEWNTTKEAFALPKHIEVMILSNFSQFSLEELGLLAHSLFAANLHPNELLEIKMLDHLHSIPDITTISKNCGVIYNIIKLSTNFSRNDAMSEKILLKYTPSINELDLNSKIQLGIFIQQQSPASSSSFIQPFIESLRNELGYCQMKDLYFIAKSIAGFNSPEKPDENFCEELMQMAVKRVQESDHLNDAKYFVMFTFQMSHLFYYSERVTNELMTITNESVLLKGAKTERDMIMGAMSDIFGRISGMQGFDKMMKTNRNNLQIIRKGILALKQIALLDTKLDSEFQAYKGQRLNSETKKKLELLNVR